MFCPSHRHPTSHVCNASPSSSRGSTPQPPSQPARPGGRAAMSRLLPPSMQSSSSKSTPITTSRPTPPPAAVPQPVSAAMSPLDARAAAASAALKRAGHDAKAPFIKSKTDKCVYFKHDGSSSAEELRRRAEAETQSAIQAMRARHEKGLLSKAEEVR